MEKKIKERFFYKGEEFIMYSDGSTNTNEQRYKDYKQYKEARIKKGWSKPIGS